MGNCCNKANEKEKANSQSFILDKENWMLNGFCTPSIYFEEDNNINYAKSQDKLGKNCQKIRKSLNREFAYSERLYQVELLKLWKNNIRAGIPNCLIRPLLIKLLDIKDQASVYNITSIQAYPETDSHNSEFKAPESPPTFSSNSLSELVPKFYVTPEGKTALERILFVIESSHIIEFCPEISSFISLLLIYFKEHEACSIVSKIIRASWEKDEKYRWHFTLTEEELVRFMTFCEAILKKNIYTLRPHFMNNVNIIGVVRDMYITNFIGYFKLPSLLRIFLYFISGGAKAFLRVVYAIFYFLKDEIPEEAVDIKSLVKSKCDTLDIDGILQCAAQAKLFPCLNTNSNYLEMPIPKRNSSIFMSTLIVESSILSITDLYWIWSNMTDFYKTFIPKLIFSSKTDGSSISAILGKCSNIDQKVPVILAISSMENYVVGAFLDCIFHMENDYFGSGESFVFSLSPVKKFFQSTGNNELYCYVQKDMMIFGGGGHGPALTIDGDLMKCSSYQCETYRNDVLGSSTFDIRCLEVIVLAGS
ncbi:unnamed protein product [Blepharisma stoltei]|uniref:TLDc domain-containing protein n=1 Tax=Blepharisma stoltei TaxID=1481888 RepID=A0AAU9IEB3_9CILI|nr:unnamed protein product [Blepharisma stoltei]